MMAAYATRGRSHLVRAARSEILPWGTAFVVAIAVAVAVAVARGTVVAGGESGALAPVASVSARRSHFLTPAPVVTVEAPSAWAVAVVPRKACAITWRVSQSVKRYRRRNH